MQQAPTLRLVFPKSDANFRTLNTNAIVLEKPRGYFQMEPSTSAGGSKLQQENFARLQEEHAKVGHLQLLLKSAFCVSINTVVFSLLYPREFMLARNVSPNGMSDMHKMM